MGTARFGDTNDSGVFAAGVGPQRAQLRHLAGTSAARVAASLVVIRSIYFLRERYVPEFKGRFAVRAEQPSSAFVGRRRPDLDLIFALQLERTVNQDNTVRVQNHRLQIAAVRSRGMLAGCSVTVHQHLTERSASPTDRIGWAATTHTARHHAARQIQL